MCPALEPAPLRRASGGAEPVYLWNPVGFDPRDCLPEALHRYADCARYILHRIHYATVFRLQDEKGFVPLKAEYLRPFFPDSKVYKRVRDRLIRHLESQGIGTRVYYPVPIHRSPLYEREGYGAVRCPEAERAAAEVVSIPVHPALDDAAVDRVIRAIHSFDPRG